MDGDVRSACSAVLGVEIGLESLWGNSHALDTVVFLS